MIPPDIFPDFIQSIKTLTEVRNLQFRAELSEIFRQAQIHEMAVEALAEQFLTASSMEYLARSGLVAEEMVSAIGEHQVALAGHEVVQAKQLVENWLTFTLDQARNELFNHQAFAQFPYGITDQRISDYFGNGLTAARGTAFGAAGEIIRKKIKATAEAEPPAPAPPATPEKPVQKRVVAPCPNCPTSRTCLVHCSHSTGVRGDSDFMWTEKFSVLECEECSTCFVQQISSNSEDRETVYDEEGNANTIEFEKFTYLPAQKKRTRPRWLLTFANYPNRRLLLAGLQEMYAAIDGNLLMLAGIGVRTCFDVASEILGVEPTFTFDQKLNDLFEKHLISRGTHDHLKVLVDFGNASAHRGWIPLAAQLQTMAEVLEEFLYEAIVREDEQKVRALAVSHVKSAVPPKPVRPKKSKAP